MNLKVSEVVRLCTSITSNEEFTIFVLWVSPVIFGEFVALGWMFSILPFLALIIVSHNFVLTGWNFQTSQRLMYCRGIVCSDTKPAFFRVVDWTMTISSFSNWTHFPVTWFNSSITGKICYYLLVLLIALVHSRYGMIIIIIGNSLFRSSSDSVMMLVYTHSIKHDIFGFQNLLYLRILSFLVYNFICENLVWSMKIGLSESDLALWISPWSEITRPILVILVSIWEHVIIFCWVSQILLFYCIHVHVWRWVHDCHIIILAVEVRYQLIVARKIHVSISICEVFAPWDHEMIA